MYLNLGGNHFFRAVCKSEQVINVHWLIFFYILTHCSEKKNFPFIAHCSEIAFYCSNLNCTFTHCSEKLFSVQNSFCICTLLHFLVRIYYALLLTFHQKTFGNNFALLHTAFKKYFWLRIHLALQHFFFRYEGIHFEFLLYYMLIWKNIVRS